MDVVVWNYFFPKLWGYDYSNFFVSSKDHWGNFPKQSFVIFKVFYSFLRKFFVELKVDEMVLFGPKYLYSSNELVEAYRMTNSPVLFLDFN